MKSNFQDLQQFHSFFDVDQAWAGAMRVHPQVIELRAKLIKEEVAAELFPALNKLMQHASPENITEVADALVDSVYVLLGTAVALDLPWQELWDEVHRSNMAKVHSDGSIKRREDGKILKPEGWKPPDLHTIILNWLEGRAVQRNPELAERYTLEKLRQPTVQQSLDI